MIYVRYFLTPCLLGKLIYNSRSLSMITLISLLVLLCGNIQAKEIQSSGEVLTELENPVSLAETYMNYKKISKKLKCNIQINNGARYCVKIEHAISVRENSKSYIYATENGIALNEKNELQVGHVAGGYVKLFKLEFVGNHNVKLIAKSDVIVCGSFGYPCEDYFYKIGNGPEMGWVLSTGFMNQGLMETTTLMYAVLNTKINEVLNSKTEFVNSNDEGWTADHYYGKVSTKITTLPTASGRFSDLDAWVTSTKPKNKKLKQIDFHKIMKFDTTTNHYDTAEIDKFYDLDSYK